MSVQILKRPLITEKAVAAREAKNRYHFEVALGASKPAIKSAVEGHFKVKVVDVHTMIVRGKERRIGRHRGFHPNWKKAIVTLLAGQTIPVFEGK